MTLTDKCLVGAFKIRRSPKEGPSPETVNLRGGSVTALVAGAVVPAIIVCVQAANQITLCSPLPAASVDKAQYSDAFSVYVV